VVLSTRARDAFFKEAEGVTQNSKNRTTGGGRPVGQEGVSIPGKKDSEKSDVRKKGISK